jgi:hypothetical protein
MASNGRKGILFEATGPQTIRLRQEIDATFGESIYCHTEGDPTQECNLLYARMFRESSPIRDAFFVINVYAEHALLRFSRIESVGNLGDAQDKLVSQINLAVRKVGLTFVYEEAAHYDLSEEELKLAKSMIPENYRKKIEGLGIDWKEAN